MYKEDRTQRQQSTTLVAAAERCQVDDLTERRAAARTTTDGGQFESNESSSPVHIANELGALTRQTRTKPMLRNISDLGPRVKKRVTYSSSDAIVTLRPTHLQAGLASPKQLSVGEEDEVFIAGHQRLHRSSVSDTPGNDVNSQPDSRYIQRQTPTYLDVVGHTTPAQQTDLDADMIPTYQLTSCNTSHN